MAFVFPKIGALSAVTLFVGGQMAAALLISHFGILGPAVSLDPTKIVGALLSAFGVYLVLR